MMFSSLPLDVKSKSQTCLVWVLPTDTEAVGLFWWSWSIWDRQIILSSRRKLRYYTFPVFIHADEPLEKLTLRKQTLEHLKAKAESEGKTVVVSNGCSFVNDDVIFFLESGFVILYVNGHLTGHAEFWIFIHSLWVPLLFCLSTVKVSMPQILDRCGVLFIEHWSSQQ
jgi:hypothetical protein